MKVSALAVRAWENSLARLQWVRDGLIRATALNQQDQQKQIITWRLIHGRDADMSRKVWVFEFRLEGENNG